MVDCRFVRYASVIISKNDKLALVQRNNTSSYLCVVSSINVPVVQYLCYSHYRRYGNEKDNNSEEVEGS